MEVLPLRTADSKRGSHNGFGVLWTGPLNVLKISVGWHWQNLGTGEIHGPFHTSQDAYEAAKISFSHNHTV
jgi:hypothetical protein